MGYYDAQQACLNGHQVTVSYHRFPTGRKPFCPQCGEKTIFQCQNCGKEIRGDYHSDDDIFIGGPPVEVPSHCEYCGKPYPWTEKKAKIAPPSEGAAVPDPLLLVEQICSRFHLVSKQLRTRHDDRNTLEVNDEYDVQDLLHALLKIYFDDVRNEEWTPSYAGGASRVDFLLKNEQVVIEVKKTRKTLKARELGEQLIVDIARYRVHPDCKRLFCFVYDPEGWISNPSGLENDLSKSETGFEVIVLIIPKGY